MDEITQLRLQIKQIKQIELDNYNKILEKEENDIHYNLEIISKIIKNRNKTINSSMNSIPKELQRYYQWQNGYGDYKPFKEYHSHSNIHFNESQLLYCLTKLYNVVNLLHKQILIIKETHV